MIKKNILIDEEKAQPELTENLEMVEKKILILSLHYLKKYLP